MKSINIVAIAAVSVMVFAGAAEATKFDPLFRVTSLTGECTVMPKGKDAFEPAKAGQAYQYGSHLKTGRSSSLIIVLADGNECQVLANADLEMAEDTKDSKPKIIKLRAGQVDIDLDPEFENSGYGLQVETAAAICGVIGSKGSVDVRSDKDMSVTTCGVSEGKFYAKGRDFMIPEMDVDDFVSIAISADKEFTRIKNLKGSYMINCKNSSGEDQSIEVKLNAIVKIWARRADIGNSITVTIIFTSADGKIEQAFTYTQRDERSPETLQDERDEIRRGVEEALQKITESDTVVTTTTTTTTTVTTSTTIAPGLLRNNGATTTYSPTPTTYRPTPTVTIPDVTYTGRR